MENSFLLIEPDIILKLKKKVVILKNCFWITNKKNIFHSLFQTKNGIFDNRCLSNMKVSFKLDTGMVQSPPKYFLIKFIVEMSRVLYQNETIQKLNSQ